jgi:hypothetical protein
MGAPEATRRHLPEVGVFKSWEYSGSHALEQAPQDELAPVKKFWEARAGR